MQHECNFAVDRQKHTNFHQPSSHSVSNDLKVVGVTYEGPPQGMRVNSRDAPVTLVREVEHVKPRIEATRVALEKC
jgi:hypothetical protein